MRKRYPAVMRPDFDEEDMGQMRILPERGRNVIRPYPRRVPRFEKGSQEAKDYMASIRNSKQGRGFFSKLGKEIKKGAKKLEKILREEQKKQEKILKREQAKGNEYCLENELVMKHHLCCLLLELLLVELLGL